MERLVEPWTHWRDEDKNLFLVIDIPADPKGVVVLMQVKDYKKGEELLIQRIPYPDWVTITEEDKALIKCVPKLV